MTEQHKKPNTPTSRFAWLQGPGLGNRRAGLRAEPKDFGSSEGKTYISFPPFPALLMMPFVWLAGSPENFPGRAVHRVGRGFGAAFSSGAREVRRKNASGESHDADRGPQRRCFALLYASARHFVTAVEGGGGGSRSC